MDGQHASKWLRCRLLLFCVNSTRIVFLPAVHNLSGRVHPGRCFLVLSVDTCFFFLFLPPPEKKCTSSAQFGNVSERAICPVTVLRTRTVFMLLIDTERTLAIYTCTVWKTDKKILSCPFSTAADVFSHLSSLQGSTTVILHQHPVQSTPLLMLSTTTPDVLGAILWRALHID
jgi:hypothetical protein